MVAAFPPAVWVMIGVMSLPFRAIFGHLRFSPSSASHLKTVENRLFSSVFRAFAVTMSRAPFDDT
jgi:hypothetical protein